MTTSLKSQLAAALKRVDELERALVTFEAMSPDLRVAMEAHSHVSQQLAEISASRDRLHSEVLLMSSQMSTLNNRLGGAEAAMSEVLNARSREEAEWIINKYRGVDQPPSTYDPYSYPRPSGRNMRNATYYVERDAYGHERIRTR